MRKFWLIALLSVLRIFPAAAYDITITAEKRVEVYQDEKKAVAVGNAVAVKPGMTVKGERLTAYFTQTGGENGEKKTSVTDMTAEQNVSLHMEKADAFGERMEYHVKDDYMVIKGKPALIKNDKAKITADGNITYYPGRNKAVARDNVIADNGKNKIYSEVMETYFKKDAEGNPALQRVEIPQNPKIVTQDGTVTTKTGIYYPDKGKVYLYENVVINQNGNILKGDKAETDLNTGISKVLSGQSRVSGIWYEEE